MTNPDKDQAEHIQNTLITIQRLTLKAVNASSLQNLIFIILNDTFQAIKYDRAILFRREQNKVEILGVSGQANINARTELASRLKTLVQKLQKPLEQRILKGDDFSSLEEWNYIQSLRPSTIYWVPFKAGTEELGLWLEIYDDLQAAKHFEMHAPLLKEMVAPAYAAAWGKIHHPFRKIVSYCTLKNLGIASALFLALLLIIPVHLRIVAPCEVVAAETFIVTAPLDGIIEKVNVRSGQEVIKNQILYEFDKKVPTYKYRSISKEVEILAAELNQAYALGINSDAEASKLSLLDLKLKKSKVDLAYVLQQLDLLMGKSPISGLVSIDSPDDWRGRPVKIGEKIMLINNQGETKLKIWIPERDHIAFDFDLPIRVFLNSIPSKTFEAKILFISPEVKVTDGELPSFEAEAEWLNVEEYPNLGLKGSAVIYGERVSIFYYIFRKPIGALRQFMGI